MLKIAAMVPYQVDECPGQRFRIETWAKWLAPRGVEVEFFAFGRPELTAILYRPGEAAAKAAWLLRCYAEQVLRVVRARRPDLVYIYHRGASLIGPDWIERLTRRWKVPIIYDIDEPIFLPTVGSKNPAFSWLKSTAKPYALAAMSDHVLAVNRAIADHLAPRVRAISIVPMAVDTRQYRPVSDGPRDGPPRVGWVGSRTTQPYLRVVSNSLARLQKSHGAAVRVIGDEPIELPGVDLEFLRWTRDEEIPRLQECSVGIVPLVENAWAHWKFNYKTIQYMSLGIPVVATPIGCNTEIIRDGSNGFLVRTDEQWYDRLRLLIESPDLRREIGGEGRKTVESGFSLDRQVDFLEGLFKGIA